MITPTNWELPHIIILGAYGLQSLELMFLPVPSEFTTHEILRRHRNEPNRGLISQLMKRALLAVLGVGTVVSVGTFLLPLAIILVPEIYPILMPIPQLQTRITEIAAMIGIISGSSFTLLAVLQMYAADSPSRPLITSGVFWFCRNPISLGLILVVAGFFLTFPSWIGLIGTGGYMLNTHVRVRLEEQSLEQYYGSEYRRYKMRVGRYFPARIVRISNNE